MAQERRRNPAGEKSYTNYLYSKGLDTILIVHGTISEQIGFATFSDAFTFILLIVVLVFKPTGLFGEKTTDKV